MNKWLMLFLGVAVAVPCLIVGIAVCDFKYRSILPSPLSESVILTIPPGVGAEYLFRSFPQMRATTKILTRLYVYKRSVKKGEYEIKPGDSFAELISKIVNGRVLVRSFRIAEGWRYENLITALASNQHIQHLFTTWPALAKEWGVSYSNPEGLFFPDTYFYVAGDRDIDIMYRAFLKMQHVLNTLWAQRLLDIQVPYALPPYKSPYDALIVASLIEKETAAVHERALISGVIINRLQHHMRLQIDPTVIYSLGVDYKGPLTRTALKKESPYNTYQHQGLPPTPIAFSGWAAIRAALYPQPSDYLYYVARARTGMHQFSQNYDQHLCAVAAYRIARLGPLFTCRIQSCSIVQPTWPFCFQCEGAL